jgi:hypothetical protein
MPRFEAMKGRLTMAAMGLSILVLAAPAAAQDVDDAVALHLKARGGAEKWASIQSQRTTGTINAGGIELGMTLIVARPNMMRQDLVIEMPGQDPVSIHTAFDGTRAWAINPMSGSVEPQELSGPEAQSARDQADFDGPLIGYREKGHTVTLVGRETVAGRPALHLRIDRGSDPAIDYFIDAESGAELRLQVGGASGTRVDFSDHRTIDGILVPHRISVLAPTGPADIVVSSVEFNVETTPETFRLP